MPAQAGCVEGDSSAMSEIAPLNYERWAVVISPLVVSDPPGVLPGSGARHAEQLTQVGASLNRLDTRKKESLIEQSIQPVELRRKILKRKSEPPSITSHPAEWVLLQPRPNEIFNSDRNQPALGARKIVELYEHPDPTPVPAVRISG